MLTLITNGEVAPVTENTARILNLSHKELRRDSLEIVHVLSRGVFMVRDGEPVVREQFLESSSREIHLVGEKASNGAE